GAGDASSTPPESPPSCPPSRNELTAIVLEGVTKPTMLRGRDDELTAYVTALGSAGPSGTNTADLFSLTRVRSDSDAGYFFSNAVPLPGIDRGGDENFATVSSDGLWILFQERISPEDDIVSARRLPNDPSFTRTTPPPFSRPGVAEGSTFFASDRVL